MRYLWLTTLAVSWATTPEATPEPEPTDAAPEATAPAAPSARNLTYAMRSTFTSQMKNPNPFAGTGWLSTHTFTWSLLRWEQTGTRIVYEEETCGVSTEPVFGAETIYRDAFIKAVPRRTVIASVSSVEPGAMFAAGPYAQQFGVSLADPYNDPLPTTADDAALLDADKDGHPGVTVEIYHPMVGRGEVYIAQRSVVRLEGTVDGEGVVRGFVRTAPNMYKIDANRWFLRGDTPQRPHPNPDMSPFIMQPKPANTTCADVMANKAAWFPKDAYDMGG